MIAWGVWILAWALVLGAAGWVEKKAKEARARR